VELVVAADDGCDSCGSATNQPIVTAQLLPVTSFTRSRLYCRLCVMLLWLAVFVVCCRYSTALTFYFMLTATVPFGARGLNDAQIVAGLLESHVRPMLPPDFPARLCQLLQRMWPQVRQVL
jgi:hypothetical protein